MLEVYLTLFGLWRSMKNTRLEGFYEDTHVCYQHDASEKLGWQVKKFTGFIYTKILPSVNRIIV